MVHLVVLNRRLYYQDQQHPDIRIPLELTVQDWSLPAPSHTRDETVAFNQHSGQSAAKKLR